jgi:hypothetical protein
MKHYILVAVLLCLTVNITNAIYYKIPYFARPASLGEAFVSVSDDATSIFYNPAGLNTTTLSFSLTEWFLDTRAGSIAGSYNYNNYFTYGVGFSFFSYGHMRYYDEEGNPGEYFNAGIWHGKISLSSQFKKLIAFGVAPKIVSQKIDTVSDTKTGFDLGLLLPIKSLNIGFSLRDVGIDELYDFGITIKPVNDLLLTADINYQDETKFGAGVEYHFNLLFFRVGYNNKRMSGGIGYTQKGFSFDYAISNHSSLGLTHQFSITIK